MENGRIKEKKNRQEFEHNLPGPTCRTNMPKYAGENNTGNKALQSMSRSRCIGTIVFMV